MSGRGSGTYARGLWAVAICERCSKKRLRRHLTYDGQFPDLLVCIECWEPKHPQEYLPEVTDPITIYDPTGDPDKLQANIQIISPLNLGPTAGGGNLVVRPVLPLSIRLGVNRTKFTLGVGSGITPTPGVALVGAGTIDSGSDKVDTTPALPAGVSEFDFMIAVVAATGATADTPPAPAGWTKYFDFDHMVSFYGAVYYKVAGAAEAAPTFVFSAPHTGRTSTAQIIVYTNVDNTEPFSGFQVYNDNWDAAGDPQNKIVLYPNVPFNSGDRVFTVSFSLMDASVLTLTKAVADNSFMDSDDPWCKLQDWAMTATDEPTNLLGFAPNDISSLTTINVTPTTDRRSGALVNVVTATPSAQRTGFEATFAATSGSTYWVGTIISARGQGAAGVPIEHYILALDDGTEVGQYFKASLVGTADDPVFESDLGAGIPSGDRWIKTIGGYGTMVLFKWAASSTGTVTVRILGSDTDGTDTHSRTLTADGNTVSVENLWVTEDANNPLMPALRSATPRAGRFAPRFLGIGATNKSMDINTISFSIKTAGSGATPVTLTEEFTAPKGRLISDLNVEGPSAFGQATVINNAIKASFPRRANAGKYYFEMTIDATQPPESASLNQICIGLTGIDFRYLTSSTVEYLGQVTSTPVEVTGMSVRPIAQAYRFGSVFSPATTGFSTAVAGDVMAFAVDFDLDTVEYYLNNSLEGDLMAVSSTVTFDDTLWYFPGMIVGTENNAMKCTLAFKSADLAFTPPTGFSPWSDE